MARTREQLRGLAKEEVIKIAMKAERDAEQADRQLGEADQAVARLTEKLDETKRDRLAALQEREDAIEAAEFQARRNQGLQERANAAHADVCRERDAALRELGEVTALAAGAREEAQGLMSIIRLVGLGFESRVESKRGS